MRIYRLIRSIDQANVGRWQILIRYYIIQYIIGIELYRRQISLKY